MEVGVILGNTFMCGEGWGRKEDFKAFFKQGKIGMDIEQSVER